MSGMLGTAVSGLMAFQRSLTTISNNIANANTEGYSRQRVELSEAASQYSGAGFTGSGVQVANITRSYDDFISGQLRSSSSAVGDVASYKDYADQVDNLVANEDTGVAPALQSFFNSLNDVANEPSSLAARETMLVQAEAFTYRVGVVGERLEEIGTQVNADLQGMTDEINSYTQAIASLNQRISDNLALSSNSNKQPNDLLDQRDLALNKLSSLVDVNVADLGGGKISVMMSNGQPLVTDNRAATLGIQPSKNDPAQMDIYLIAPGTTAKQVVTDKFKGGEVSGALRFREELLEPAQQKLGAMVAAIAIEFNALHQEGYDYNGNKGEALFSFNNVTEVPVSQVNGTEVASVKLEAGLSTIGADSANIDTSDYLLKIVDNGSGGNEYILERIDDGSEITLTLNTDAADTTVDANGVYGSLVAGASDNLPGITLNFTTTAGTNSTINVPKIGDEFFIRPTFTAAKYIQMNITDAEKVAAATNLDTDGTTVINGAMIGDNRNMLKLADLANQSNMFGGTAGFQETYGQVVSRVGALTHAADISVTAQESLLNNAVEARDAKSGVNLDEEAANLMRYQQAYQAAAQSIAGANQMFNTLLQAVR